MTRRSSLRDSVRDDGYLTAEELVAGVTDLVSLPEVALRVNQMIDDLIGTGL